MPHSKRGNSLHRELLLRQRRPPSTGPTRPPTSAKCVAIARKPGVPTSLAKLSDCVPHVKHRLAFVPTGRHCSSPLGVRGRAVKMSVVAPFIQHGATSAWVFSGGASQGREEPRLTTWSGPRPTVSGTWRAGRPRVLIPVSQAKQEGCFRHGVDFTREVIAAFAEPARD